MLPKRGKMALICFSKYVTVDQNTFKTSIKRNTIITITPAIWIQVPTGFLKDDGRLGPSACTARCEVGPGDTGGACQQSYLVKRAARRCCSIPPGGMQPAQTEPSCCRRNGRIWKWNEQEDCRQMVVWSAAGCDRCVCMCVCVAAHPRLWLCALTVV